jgi:phosphoglycolate phosphatase
MCSTSGGVTRRCRYRRRVPPVIGFDLDMTLLDTRAGIAATFRALSERTGVPIDADRIVSRLGPPLRHEMAHWFPAADVERAVALYRELYPSYAIAASEPLPGAGAALRAVTERGGRVVVITAKLGRLAETHLAHHGLVVDRVIGDVFDTGKTDALREVDAAAYVGDHTADMVAAVRAGVPAVGVATGPCLITQLRDAGADVAFDSLVEFPGWFMAADLGWPGRSK